MFNLSQIIRYATKYSGIKNIGVRVNFLVQQNEKELADFGGPSLPTFSWL